MANREVRAAGECSFLLGKRAAEGLRRAAQNRCAPRRCRFLTAQKAAEKRAATSDAWGTGQGACGPLGNPRGFEEVARDTNIVDPKRPYVTPFPVRAYRVSPSGLPI